MVDANLIVRVRELSAAERLGLMGLLWATCSSGEVPVTKEEKALLDERIAEAEAHPDDQSAWSEVRERLRRH